MAESIGLLASILQLADYTLKVYNFASQIKRGPKERVAIASETSELFTLLHCLRMKREDISQPSSHPSSNSAERVQLLNRMVNELSVQLEELIGKVNEPATSFLAKSKWPLDQKECQKLLDRIQRLKGTIQLILQGDLCETLQGGIKEIKVNLELLVEGRDEQYWTRTRELFPNARSFRKQQIVFGSRQDGTGDWLLREPKFIEWKQSVGEMLWCHGIPGAGKTIMASIIVDHLEKSFRDNDQIGVTCIYCNYDDPRSLYEMLSDIYMHLLSRHKVIPNQLRDWIDGIGRGDRYPNVSDLKALIQTEVNRFSKLYIVLDALDECVAPLTASQRSEIRARLKKEVLDVLISFGPRVNVLVTSRILGELPDLLAKSPQLEISAHDEDMVASIEQRIKDCDDAYCWTKMCASDAAFKGHLINTLIEKARGMFLLVRLYMDALNRQRRRKQVETCLETLPVDLNDIYKHAILRIDSQDQIQRDQGKKILTWVCFSFRPLQATELQYAEATAVDERCFDLRDLEKIESLVSCCAGLIVIDPIDNVVRFVHYSAQEYFQKHRNVHFPTGHNEMAKVCLTYLLQDGLNETDDDSHSKWDRNELCTLYPLLGYSACYWGYHAKNGKLIEQQDEELQRLAFEFLHDDRPRQYDVFAEPQKQDLESIPLPRIWQEREKPVGVHVAATFGLNDILELLLARNAASIEQEDAVGRTPLCYAASNGEQETVRYLVEKGANVNSANPAAGRTILMHAAASGRLDIIKYLVQKGADVNAIAWGLWDESTALYEACYYRYAEVVQFLLEHGAKTTIGQDDEATDHRWPLAIAASNGDLSIMKSLIKHGSRLDGRNGFLALRETVRNQEIDALRYLQTKGVDLDFLPEGEQQLWKIAAEAGSLPVIEILTRRIANPEATISRPFPKALKLLNSLPWFSNVESLSEACGSVNASEAQRRFKRSKMRSYDEYTTPHSYLGIVVPTGIKSVRKLVFRAESHDQGWCDDPGAGSYTWFDAVISYSQGYCTKPFVRRLYENEPGNSEWQTHEKTWSADDQDEGTAEFIRSIASGFVIRVTAKARFRGWINHVKSIEVVIYY